MSFCQNLFSTFIAVLFGFIFSIFLFYLTGKWAKRAQKKSLEKNLIKEFEFNNEYLKKIIADLNKVIEKITVNDKEVFIFFNYLNYQRLFISTYFQQGYLYEKLEPAEINIIDAILNQMSVTGQNYINNSIESWKGGQLSQAQIMKILGFERDYIETNIRSLAGMEKKIIGK